MTLSPQTYRHLADALVVFHLGFVAFVVTGGLLVLRWRRVMWLHLPAAAWGVFVEFSGWICPLTPLENQLRESAGELAYRGTFVDHYIKPVLYPEGLTRQDQFAYGTLFFLVNAACYATIIYRRRKARRAVAAAASAAVGTAADAAAPPRQPDGAAEGDAGHAAAAAEPLISPR